MKEDIKNLLFKELACLIHNSPDQVSSTAGKIEALISSSYLSKDKVMEIAEKCFYQGYESCEDERKGHEPMIFQDVKEILKKEYGL